MGSHPSKFRSSPMSSIYGGGTPSPMDRMQQNSPKGASSTTPMSNIPEEFQLPQGLQQTLSSSQMVETATAPMTTAYPPQGYASQVTSVSTAISPRQAPALAAPPATTSMRRSSPPMRPTTMAQNLSPPKTDNPIQFPKTRAVVSFELNAGRVHILTLSPDTSQQASFTNSLKQIINSTTHKYRVLLPTSKEECIYSDKETRLGLPTCHDVSNPNSAMAELQQLQAFQDEATSDSSRGNDEFPSKRVTFVPYDRRMDVMSQPRQSLDSIALKENTSSRSTRMNEELLEHHENAVWLLRDIIGSAALLDVLDDETTFRALRVWLPLVAAYEILMNPKGHHIIVAPPDVAEDLGWLFDHYGLLATCVEGRMYNDTTAITVEAAMFQRRMYEDVIQPHYYLRGLSPQHALSRMMGDRSLARLPDTVQEAVVPVNFSMMLSDFTIQVIGYHHRAKLQETSPLQTPLSIAFEAVPLPTKSLTVVLGTTECVMARVFQDDIQDTSRAPMLVSWKQYFHQRRQRAMGLAKALLKEEAARKPSQPHVIPPFIQKVLQTIQTNPDQFEFWGPLYWMLHAFAVRYDQRQTRAMRDLPPLDTCVLMLPYGVKTSQSIYGFPSYLESVFEADIQQQPPPMEPQPQAQ